MSNPFAGTWSYRSFLNSPTPTGGDPAKLAELLFAEGTWTAKDAEANVFDGELNFGVNDILDLKGVGTPAQPGLPAHAHIVGQGRRGTSTECLFYHYDGSLTEQWPKKLNQILVITGVGDSRTTPRRTTGRTGGVVHRGQGWLTANLSARRLFCGSAMKEDQ